MTILAERLKDLREVRFLNVTQAAKYLGLTRTAYSNYENGIRQPDYETLMHIADMYNCSIDYLFGRADE